jgi:CRP-like cAMP-binding protein
LAALPAAYYERQVFEHLQPCLFHLGDTLFDATSEIKYVYFLKSGIVSLIMDAIDGINVEVAIVGCEGVVGAGEALTGVRMVSRAEVQIAGSGWRLPVDVFRQAFKSNGVLQDVYMRYQQFLSLQAAQCALCNRRHSIEQRLSRWLLMASDRTNSDTLELTHEFMATMLGTRRAGISIAANQLRSEGLIGYKRAMVTILDPEGLANRACECHAPLEHQYQQLIHKTPDKPLVATR